MRSAWSTNLGFIMGIYEAKPQRGTGAESLLKGSGGKVPETGCFLGFRCQRRGGGHLTYFQCFKSCLV